MVDVAVINTSVEVARTIEEVLQQEGWTTARAFTLDLKEGRVDLEAFMAEQDPSVVIWDIALPYAENYAFFQTVLERPELNGRGLVLTTTNERALTELVGPTGAIEIIGKPFDLHQITDAVTAAMRTMG